jgi:hypothetical protein
MCGTVWDHSKHQLISHGQTGHPHMIACEKATQKGPAGPSLHRDRVHRVPPRVSQPLGLDHLPGCAAMVHHTPPAPTGWPSSGTLRLLAAKALVFWDGQ